MDKVVKLKKPLQVDCPFCLLGHYIVDAAIHGDRTVLHSMPTCQTFMDNEITDYLVLAREARKNFGEKQ